ncbi:unnamed protein product [Lepidochelys olivacea]
MVSNDQIVNHQGPPSRVVGFSIRSMQWVSYCAASSLPSNPPHPTPFPKDDESCWILEIWRLILSYHCTRPGVALQPLVVYVHAMGSICHLHLHYSPRFTIIY